MANYEENDLHRRQQEPNRLERDRPSDPVMAARFYETLFNHTVDAIFVQDADGRLLTVNDEACDRMGYSREELLRMTPAELDIPVFGSSVLGEPDQKASAEQAVFLTVHRTKEGRVIPTEVSTRLIQSDGKPYLFSVARDVTERVKAEEGKTRLEAQLRQAQKMEAIGTLAGGIAHDFNNILAAIIGYTELAMSHLPQDSPIQTDLKRVFAAGKRARDLVQQILTFSHQTEVESRPVLVHLIVKEAIRLLRASLPSTITILQKIDPSAGAVKADPTQIHQVVMNLCTNAYHAMREEGGILEVSLGPFLVDAEFASRNPNVNTGDYVRLSIADTGQGIDEGILERIFDPFFTTKPMGEGTGMGLSVVNGIVTGCGGTVLVSSTPGEGSVFEVYLPRIQSLETARPEPMGPLPRGNEHILLVDDEEVLLEMNREMLQRLGYRITATTNSVDALALFRSDPTGFDLVITDQTMPQVTGLQLAEGIIKVREKIPIILCTGFSETITTERVKQCGVRALLFKPITQWDLAGAIRKTLDEKD